MRDKYVPSDVKLGRKEDHEKLWAFLMVMRCVSKQSKAGNSINNVR